MNHFPVKALVGFKWNIFGVELEEGNEATLEEKSILMMSLSLKDQKTFTPPPPPLATAIQRLKTIPHFRKAKRPIPNSFHPFYISRFLLCSMP